MSKTELHREFTRLLKKCPQCMTPSKINRSTPLSRNRIYELLRTGELPSFIYQGTYVVNKDDVIEYLVHHSQDTTKGFTVQAKTEEVEQ